ncbi:HNH endonuclease signature motif containing protein [Streptomyces sp. NPDC005953]|uniref:HNH endonuclease n=1 Tax=Streptomyces sp. NPDC005953 TaxID=3156719 RepID=UPI00340D993F
MGRTDITHTAVLRAIEEFDRLGRDAFLTAYGFHPARSYFLVYEGRRYDSKAVFGAAHGFLPGRDPLRPGDFSGGAAHAARLLGDLGFTVVQERPDAVEAEPLPPSSSLSHDELVRLVSRLKVSRANGAPALHQPITLLWAMGRALRGEDRLLSWSETEAAVRALVERHGVRGERPRVDYPVAALSRAGLWALPAHQDAVPTAHGDAGLRRWFAGNQPVGGLSEPVYERLRRFGETRLAVLEVVLGTYFVGLDCEPLLRDVGLFVEDLGLGEVDPAVVRAARYELLCASAEGQEVGSRGRRVERIVNSPVRLASARMAVLYRSEGNCEHVHCGGQPNDVTDAGQPILEVDHIVEIARGGRDHPSQMAALCPNCHAVKTRGSTREAMRDVLLASTRERHDRWMGRAYGGRGGGDS